MLPLHPGNTFTVVRQIANHLDTDTNYVRAVIRNAYTDAVIETLELTDRGNQRFSKHWKIPFDPSGQGFYISIVTSVYSDSGYTTKNPNYGDEETTYIVQDRVLHGGSGGGGIDSRTARRIFREEMEAMHEAKKAEESKKGHKEKTSSKKEENEHKPIDFTPVLDGLLDLREALEALSKKEPETFDYKPFNEAREAILNAIADKEVTEATDIEPLLSALQQIAQDAMEDKKEVIAAVEALTSTLQNLPQMIQKFMAETQFKIAPTIATMEGPIEKKQEAIQEEKPVSIDLNQLTI